MSRMFRILNVALIVGLLSLAVVGVAYAQEGGGDPALGPFMPILAATVAIERLLQLIRNIVSPNPDKGPLARGTPALQYYTTIGGLALGLLIAFASGHRLLESAGIALEPTVDTVLTGIVIGLGSEFTHEAIKVVGEAKYALRHVKGAGTPPDKT